MADTASLADANITIEYVQVVSSYNCVKEDSRTIIVPGTPAKWLECDDKPKLRPDRGIRLLDHNAGNWPESPMEPGIRAVLHLRPDFDFTKLHIIADRYQIACCLELALRNGKKVKKLYLDDDGTFCFGAQVVGGTVVFFRSDGVTPQNITSFRGFADDFKRAYLSYPEGFESSTAHYRIVNYRLGSLNILLRHAANGYVADGTTNNDASPPSLVATQVSGAVKVQSGVVLIPHSAMLEPNTFSKKQQTTKKKRKAKKAQECWLLQSAYCVVAEYGEDEAVKSGKWTARRGAFDTKDINFIQMTSDMPEWAGGDKETTQRFYDLLQDLVARIHSLAAAGERDTFMVEYCGEGMHIDVLPSKEVCGLSEELSRRVRGS